MMLDGKKPAALIDPSKHTDWEPHIKSGKIGYVVHTYTGPWAGQKSLIMHLPGEEWRAKKISSLLNSTTKGSASYHIKLGRLLGYSKDHIRKFNKSTGAV